MKAKPLSILARPPTWRRRRDQFNTMETLERRALLASTFFDGGGGDNLWNNPDNWYYHQVPTAQDDVSIGYGFDVVLTGAPAAVRTLSMWGEGTSLSVSTALDVAMNSNAYPGTAFNLAPGGTLDGAGNLTLHGELNWTGGAMRGDGRTVVAFGAQTDITGADFKELARTLRLEQSAQIAQGEVRFDGGTLEIDPRATLLLNGAQLTSVGGTNRVDNAGQINTSGFLVRIDVPLFHSGAAQVSSNLDLRGGGSATGSFELATAGTRLLVGALGYMFDTGSTISGEGAKLWISGGTTTVAEPTSLVSSVVSGGQLTFHGNLDVAGESLVEGGGVLRLEGAYSELTTIQVETGGKIMLVGDGTHVLRTTYPGIQESGYLDIGREAVIFDYPAGYSSLDDVRGKITSGYLDGSWVGSGICSQLAGTTGGAIGYAEATALFTQFPATFIGQTVDDTSILVRYTRPGDANLDGTVNLADFNMLATGFGVTDAYWTQGDFNYTQTVTLADFNLLAGNFGQSARPEADESKDEELLS